MNTNNPFSMNPECEHPFNTNYKMTIIIDQYPLFVCKDIFCCTDVTNLDVLFKSENLIVAILKLKELLNQLTIYEKYYYKKYASTINFSIFPLYQNLKKKKYELK